MDIWTTSKRSKVMSRIRGKNTKPELKLRSALFSLGYRFRIHVNTLPGKPDIVLPKFKLIIFVHGCFWHYHRKCKEGRIPSTNSIYWKQKLEKNVFRDRKSIQQLRKIGWKVITVWECEIERKIDSVVNRILKIR